MSYIAIERHGRHDGLEVLQLELSAFRFDREPASIVSPLEAERRLTYAVTLECGECRQNRRMYVAEASVVQTLRGEEVVSAKATFVFVLGATGGAAPPSADDGRHFVRTAIWARFAGLVGETNGSTRHPLPPMPATPSFVQDAVLPIEPPL